MPDSDNPLLTILTVNYNTSDYLEVMLYAFSKLTKNPYRVIVCDNGSSNHHLLRLAQVARDYDNVEVIFRTQSAPGSIGHGEAMDLLVSKVETPYFVTMDADATFLLDQWDELLLSRLSDTVKAIGTQASGDKPKDFPLMYAVLYDTGMYRDMGLSFLPKGGGTERQNGKLMDTGWRIREEYHNHGLAGEVLELRNTRTWKDGPFSDFWAVGEFYLQGEPRLAVCHFGRGSSSGLAKFNAWWRRIPVVGGILARIKGRLERRAWIKRARQIVDES